MSAFIVNEYRKNDASTIDDIYLYIYYGGYVYRTRSKSRREEPTLLLLLPHHQREIADNNIINNINTR